MVKIQNQKTIRNVSAIVNDLMSKSHYKPLKTLFFCKDFLNSLPPAKQRLIARIYIKNDILNIITSHPAGFQELNHDNSKIYIKILIKKYAQVYPLSGFSNIKDIRVMTQKYSFSVKNEENIKKNPYIELSLGCFKNTLENKVLANKFEELRQIIKNA
ncbi:MULTISPECIES: hypothetical protein [Campylobacter]|uniref:DUF721 domain-containing protein n=1 Tax=Campylobacter taeniopygiae TaxID=2510188 RepID=A0ABY2TIF0_9BACT|nr:hypothetical protein [Campylobacter taeniopygiae]MBZ7938226.1 hypothetical protein [Campylobacter sp. W0014]MBZ7953336.1 hypothetical protein [Campylobacter sp. W0018]TKX33886.1 hypothetical protein CQA75_05165 [Campylobacter taeniopygiae]